MTIELGIGVLCIVGLLVYALATNGKVVEVGRLIFACALLAVLLGARGHLTLR